MKAVIYSRCSTGRQAEKELSIPAQEKICRKYALDAGYELDRAFSDEGQSATTDNRPGFLDAIEYVKDRKSKISAFVCYDTSRFARNREDAIVYKKLLRSSGVKVLYATQSFSDHPDGAF